MKKINTFNRGIFLDSSSVDEIKKWNTTGIIDGVTTNQSIMLRDGVTLNQLVPTIKKICLIMKEKPVSIELSDSSAGIEDMIKEAQKYRKISDNVIIKVPIIPGSIKTLEVIKKLGDLKIPVNVTVMMNFEQLIVASLAIRNHPMPSFVSFFWARSIEDNQKYMNDEKFISSHQILGKPSQINSDPKSIVGSLKDFLREGDYKVPKLIVGSIRNVSQVGESFSAGANIVTVSPKILQEMLFSQRTIETNEEFNASWQQLRK